jgi:hypothetical protein
MKLRAGGLFIAGRSIITIDSARPPVTSSAPSTSWETLTKGIRRVMSLRYFLVHEAPAALVLKRHHLGLAEIRKWFSLISEQSGMH